MAARTFFARITRENLHIAYYDNNNMTPTYWLNMDRQ